MLSLKKKKFILNITTPFFFTFLFIIFVFLILLNNCNFCTGEILEFKGFIFIIFYKNSFNNLKLFFFNISQNFYNLITYKILNKLKFIFFKSNCYNPFSRILYIKHKF